MSTHKTLPDAQTLTREWRDSPRWKGVTRPYKAEDVVRLRGSVHVEHSIARLTSEKLWRFLQEKPFVNALGALTGNQAMQQVRAGLDAIYLSGWQVAGDANLAGQMYPDQSLYPADSVPAIVKRINNTLLRADQIQTAEGKGDIDWLKPIVADAEAGFGGVLNAFELMKAMIEPAPPACTSRTSSPRPRSAATWAARCWCRRRKRSPSWPPRASRPTRPACRPSWWRAPMPRRPTC